VRDEVTGADVFEAVEVRQHDVNLTYQAAILLPDRDGDGWRRIDVESQPRSNGLFPAGFFDRADRSHPPLTARDARILQ
jgi:hypothetical protein